MPLSRGYHELLQMSRSVVRRFRGPLRRAAKRNPTLRKARDELVGRYHGALLKGAGARGGSVDRASGVDPGRMVWIFCTSRSGSTWLRSMMAELGDHKVWEEPGVGRLFGGFYRRAQKGQLASPDFIMANPTREGWLRSVRNFILDGAHYAHPFLKGEHYLVIKEPDGSSGAPLILEALPESCMLFLIRDPRDVVASTLDATRRGSWMYETVDSTGWKEKDLADKNPDNFVRSRSKAYLRQIQSLREAYAAHKGPKILVRYEDLRADALNTMRRIYSTLKIPVADEALLRAVERHSWESIPEGEKGEGKFYRKASPGGWREDLTLRQIEIIEGITAPLLEAFYPETYAREA